MKYDLYISYANQDEDIAGKIGLYLHLCGLRCFAPYRAPESDPFNKEFEDALRESQMVLVVFSESYNQSKEVLLELELATQSQKPVLVLKLSDSSFGEDKKHYLEGHKCMDVFEVTNDTYKDLYKIICELTGKEVAVNIPEPSSLMKPKPPKPKMHELLTKELNKPSSEAIAWMSKKSIIQLNGDSTQLADTGVGMINGHEYVDLGLPSGLKWATCNVGASSPEQIGEYYAWGEIEPKDVYSEENGQTYDKDLFWLINNDYTDMTGKRLPSHDLAHKKWGEPWHMPTSQDLLELQICTTTQRVCLNGVSGFRLKSRKNGNSIFLPASGWVDGVILYAEGQQGKYWSGSKKDDSSIESMALMIHPMAMRPLSVPRYFGLPIRAVCK